MKYLSICSGIEAATAAWHPLRWTPLAFAEIDPFASTVLRHHYHDVPNLGDMAKWKDWPDAAFDILVGGTPCQSFSIAGLRQGLADPRGNLMLTYLAITERYRPEWLVWENVPGTLSVDGGRAFGDLVQGLAELRYHAAWRVLDAQYVRVDGFERAVPQRRRRVFVVGHLGDWRRAAAVLFEPESLSGHPAPRREAGKGIAPTIASRPTGGGGLGTDFDCDGGLIASHDPACTLNARDYKGPLPEADLSTVVAHSLRGDGFDASEDDTGRGTPLIAFSAKDHGGDAELNLSPILRAGGGGKPGQGYPAIQSAWAVRRLTPRECERLQGFPDDYTNVPYRGRPAADGPRYKALGNSMAVNVMRWIGRRIEMVESLTRE